MRKFASLVGLLLLLPACVSLNSSGQSYLDRIEQLKIGANEGDVTSLFGESDEISKDGNFTRFVYNISHGRYTVPKVQIWLDQDRRVVRKSINLFDHQEGELFLSHLNKRYSPSWAELPSDPRLHYIPSDKWLTDKQLGLTAHTTVVESRKDPRVFSLHWYPAKGESSRTPAAP